MAPKKAGRGNEGATSAETRGAESDVEAEIDEASEASFPASDPPAWGGMPPGGPRRRGGKQPPSGS